jgi:hypothetical protein
MRLVDHVARRAEKVIASWVVECGCFKKTIASEFHKKYL